MEENVVFEQSNSDHRYWEFLVSSNVRFVNFIVDRIIFMLFIFILGVFSGLLGVGKFWEDLAENRFMDIVFSLILYALFMFVQEYFFKTTLGKLITGTRILSVSGYPLTSEQLLKRNFARIIPFEPFTYFINNIGWHDSLSQTRIVKKYCPLEFSEPEPGY